jgi:CO dehydrogenase/acetyl-CoA synthase delta subunit
MFEVIYRFTDIRENIKDVQCDVFDTIDAAREFILEQFDSLVEDTTDWETGEAMVEEDGWYENFILDKYEIRQMEVTLN